MEIWTPTLLWSMMLYTSLPWRYIKSARFRFQKDFLLFPVLGCVYCCAFWPGNEWVLCSLFFGQNFIFKCLNIFSVFSHQKEEKEKKYAKPGKINFLKRVFQFLGATPNTDWHTNAGWILGKTEFMFFPFAVLHK